MLAYLRSEIHRLTRRRMAAVLLLLLALIGALLYVIQYFALQQQLQAIRGGTAPQGAPPEEVLRRALNGLRPDAAPEAALGSAAVLSVMFAIILAASATGNEFSWATVRTVLAHGGRRSAFIFAKLVALTLAALVLVVTGFAVTIASSFAVGALGGLDLALSGDFVGRIAGYIVRALYISLPYVTLAVMAAVFARSAAAGITIALVVFFGENLLSSLAVQLNPDLRQVFDAGVARNVQTIARTPPAAPPPNAVIRMPSAVEFSFAAFILAMYVVAFVSLTVHRFVRRDLTLA
jgi:ABC-type transport system involved in multi-copper enzyme maturation permease subunit